MSSQKVRDGLFKLKNLLTLEQEEDYRQYQEQFLRVGLEQRKQNGLSWYPVKINSEELGSNQLLTLELERTALLDHPHQFSSGKNVSLFSNAVQGQAELNGTIKSLGRNSMKVIVNCEELPDWCYEGKLGLNIQFDENSYLEMQKALDQLLKGKPKRCLELLEMVYGEKEPEYETGEAVQINSLNASQNRAIQHVLGAKDIAVVHGPPGTGKTSTMVQAIRLVVQTEGQVLVCAPTNTAVDLISVKLLELGVRVLRLGHPARVSEHTQACSLDGSMAASPHYKTIKSLRRNAETYFQMAGKYKRVFGKEEAEQRAAYYAEAKASLKEARLLEDLVEEELFRTSEVICCTPVSSTHRGLAGKKFKSLFFDEASQALEPLVWIPLLKCERLILFGDHFQLPPVVKSMEAKAGGLDRSMLDRCIELDRSTVLLNRQYRMNRVIMGFSNAWFYKGELTADESVSSQVLANESEHYLDKCLEFIDTAGCDFEEEQNPESLSYSNPGEGRVLYKHLQQLLESYSNLPYRAAIDIGVICPYKEQREWLMSHYEDYKPEQSQVREFSIKTIDGFQGEERDVIYISLVRSNEKQEIGFLADQRRMNVALTRARKKLVVIGDSSTIGNNPFYKAFLEYCENHGVYRTAWEWMD